MKTHKQFTKPKFFKWLKSLNQRHSMDVTSLIDCPIAQFMRHLGHSSASVGGKDNGFYVDENPNDNYYIPQWALDLLYGKNNPQGNFDLMPKKTVTPAYLLNMAMNWGLIEDDRLRVALP